MTTDDHLHRIGITFFFWFVTLLAVVGTFGPGNVHAADLALILAFGVPAIIGTYGTAVCLIGRPDLDRREYHWLGMALMFFLVALAWLIGHLVPADTYIYTRLTPSPPPY